MRRVQFRGYCAKVDCGKPVFSRFQKTKYCSVECAKGRFGERGSCANCRKTLNRRRKKYCSVRCQHSAYFKARCAAFEAGSYSCERGATHFIRRYLVEKLGERCTRCHWAERHPITGRVPIEIEHIDGDWRNNSVENLTLLCPNCHSLTPTYRALNKGRGRPMRLGGRQNPIAAREELKPGRDDSQE